MDGSNRHKRKLHGEGKNFAVTKEREPKGIFGWNPWIASGSASRGGPAGGGTRNKRKAGKIGVPQKHQVENLV